ncbi:MAG: DUF6514 family protein [Oscillospiraceae bacterium]|jgi:hypothetical protein
MSTAEKISVVQDKTITVSASESEKVILSEALANGRLVYRLFQSECEIDGGFTACYGIEIKSSLFDKSESEKVAGITSSFELAKELFELLTENLVTPISLKYIVEDFVTQKYS